MLELGESAVNLVQLKKTLASTDLSHLEIRNEAVEMPVEMPAEVPRMQKSTIVCMAGQRDNGTVCGVKIGKFVALKAHFNKYHKTNAPHWLKGNKKPTGYEDMDEDEPLMIMCRYLSYSYSFSLFSLFLFT